MRSVRLLAGVLSLCLACVAPACAMPGPLARLQEGLQTMSSRAPGAVAIAIKDLHTGLTTSVNAAANMPAASTIKIPVMVEVFSQMAAGKFDLNRAVTLIRSDRDDGWGRLVDAPLGSRYTVSTLLRAMIDNSDNTATNMLIRLVGRTHVNDTMASLGLENTRLGDYIRSEGDIRSLRTSPADMISLLEAMAHNQLVDEWSSREMIAILSGQRHNSLLPQPLPRGIPIAHKTGTLHDTLNDVGIVYLQNEPYAIAVMTTHLPTLDAGRRFIRGVSRLAYNALSRFAQWRQTNDVGDLDMRLNPAPAPQPAVAPPPDLRMWTPVNGPSRPAPNDADGPDVQ